MSCKPYALKHLLPVILLFLLPSALWAQAKKVSGSVHSTEGNKLLSGVSILLKGKSGGTTTNDAGEFSISADENDVLVISSIGFEAQEFPVKKNDRIQIKLRPAGEAMKDVVVVGYNTQSKKDITGSVGTVNVKELKSLPVSSVGDAMQGKAAGVQIITSGVPGSDPEIRVRGIGTINNSSPLLVIDGVPTNSGLNQLNMDDVESIQILKDASAAAIYGSRGANGVVIVTTKRGKGEGSTLNFNAYYGVQSMAHQVKMLDASQFAALHNEIMANNGLPQNPAFAHPDSLGKGTDWLGALFRNAPMQNYSLSYSASTPKTNYYISGNVFDQKGIIINTSYRRYVLQFNTDTRVLENLRFGNSVMLNHDVKKSGDYNIQNAMVALPTQPIYNPDGTYSGPVGQPSWVGDVTNPIGKAKLVENSTLGYNLRGSMYGELTLLKGLRFRTNLGLQANFWNTRNWAPKYNWQPLPQEKSYLAQGSNKSITWLWDNTLTYDKTFGDHKLTVLAGTSAQENKFDFISGNVQDFTSDQTQQLSSGTFQPVLNGNGSEWALFSYFGRVNYAYKDKYLLTGTMRRDGSSRFGAGNKYGVFPSGSFAWRVSKEDFFKNVSFLNDLKLRLGYGKTGNQEIGNYSFASVYQNIRYNFNNQSVGAVVPTVMPNPDVRWESVEQSNVGIDASLFKNRVNITADLYRKNTNDMLVPMAVPVSTGYSDIFVPSVNAGKIRNEGFEITINTRNTAKGPINWNTSFNFSYNRNKVLSLNDSVPMSVGGIGLNYNLARIQEGYPINVFYGYVTNGIFQTETEVDKSAVQVAGADPFNRTSAGDIRFKDVNNDGVIDEKDRQFLGNPNPKFIFALTNTFEYKGFDLSLFLQGVSGNKIFNANRVWTEARAVAQNQTTEVLGRWTGPGTSTTKPRAIFNDPNKNTRPSTRYIEDGSYLRIKNLSIGYTLPASLMKSAKMQSARLYVSAQNLYTFTKYTGFDPEVSSNGIDLNVYPVTRTVSFGVNLNF
jgi:TonB-linked SusC/RagA family outer membrane protein